MTMEDAEVTDLLSTIHLCFKYLFDQLNLDCLVLLNTLMTDCIIGNSEHIGIPNSKTKILGILLPLCYVKNV